MAAFGDKIKSFDFFGQSVGFEIAGRGSLNSYLGAIVSLLITALTFFYAVGRFETMLEYGDTVYMQTTEKNTMLDQTLLQKDTNFNVAFEIIRMYDFDEDISYDYFGYLELQVIMFYNDENGRRPVALGVHKCTIEEYETKFYKAEDAFIETWFDGQLFCLDQPEILDLRGQIGGNGISML